MIHPMNDSVERFLTIREAADELEVKESSIRRMISEEKIQAQLASPNQISQLLSQQRIKGVPGTGVRLIHQDEVAKAKGRRKRGRPSLKQVL